MITGSLELGKCLEKVHNLVSRGLFLCSRWCQQMVTLPETNIAPENGWLEYYFPIGKVTFQGLC